MGVKVPDNKADLILKGGHVIDPANGIDGIMDVGIRGGSIVEVGPEITADLAEVVDLSGFYVTPGLIDMHTHVYWFYPGPGNYVEGLHADAHLLSSGVTTTVDAGTAGWKNFTDFKNRCIDRSRVRILAFINIAGSGMVDTATEQNPAELIPEVAAAVAKAFPETIVGIKSAHYWTNRPWDEGHPPWASVERAIEAGTLCGKPVMVDFWPRPPERSYSELLLGRLRPGDIHTHVFARQFPVITDDGGVNELLFEARERGIVFDLGHGAGSFVYRNGLPALKNGFPPDTISTDLYLANVNGPVVSMTNTMSKFLNMGMPLTEVIARSTSTPAGLIGHPELGTLSPGSEADVAVFRRVEGEFGFPDCGRAKLTGSLKLDCVLTMRSGKIVYDINGLTMPEWENAPAPYWMMP